MTGKKFQSIQALRGVAILLVLARHILVMEDHFGGGERLLPDVVKAGDGGVDLFFVISGFIMVVITLGQFRMPGAIGSFLRKRAIRIYPLYWLYSLIVLAVFLVAPAWVSAMKKGDVDFLASFFLLPQFHPPILGQGWTLGYEIYFYLMFAFALLLPERWLARFFVVWGLIASAGYNLYLRSDALVGSATIKTMTNPVTIEFVLGGCVALAILRGWRWGDWFCLVGGSLLLPVSSVFFDPLEFPGLRIFCFGLPALLILYGAASLESRSRIRFPRRLQAVGDASYSIYLSHILVISTVGRLWSAARQPGLWDNALAILIMAAAALGCGLASYHWIEQPMLRFLNTWDPRRKSASVSTVVASPQRETQS
jgi:exopolysaccharide production protein ExoZ